MSPVNMKKAKTTTAATGSATNVEFYRSVALRQNFQTVALGSPAQPVTSKRFI